MHLLHPEKVQQTFMGHEDTFITKTPSSWHVIADPFGHRPPEVKSAPHIWMTLNYMADGLWINSIRDYLSCQSFVLTNCVCLAREDVHFLQGLLKSSHSTSPSNVAVFFCFLKDMDGFSMSARSCFPERKRLKPLYQSTDLKCSLR